MTKIKGMNFSKEIEAAYERIASLSTGFTLRPQQHDVVLNIGTYKVMLRNASASLPHTIRIELDQNKAMTLRLDKGRVRLVNLTVVGARKMLAPMLNEWTPAEDLIAVFRTPEVMRAWRSASAVTGMEDLLSTLLIAPARAANMA